MTHTPISRDFQERLAAAGSALTLSPGAVLFEADAPADSVFLVTRGQLRTYQATANDNRLVEVLGEGQWLGATALAGLSSRGFRAVAVELSSVIRIETDHFLHELSQDARLLAEVLRDLACRLDQANETASMLAYVDSESRLVHTLLRLSYSAAARESGDAVTVQITHHELAQAIGVARETVSLALTQLRQQNVVRTGRSQVHFDRKVLAGFKKSELVPLA